jgi:triosephosphate isomerase (TIM)
MRKPLVVGNWKLNGRLAENKNRMLALAEAVKNITQLEVGLCLPYVYLFQAQQLLANTGMLWGAQNVSQFVQGAYTAENSQKAVIRIQGAVDAGRRFIALEKPRLNMQQELLKR